MRYLRLLPLLLLCLQLAACGGPSVASKGKLPKSSAKLRRASRIRPDQFQWPLQGPIRSRYGMRHGRVFYMTGGEKTAVTASWAQEKTIPQMIDDAWKHHRQLQVEYIGINPESGERTGIQQYTIDLLDLNGEQMDVFIVETQAKQRLDRRLVWQIEDTGETSAHQSALF